VIDPARSAPRLRRPTVKARAPAGIIREKPRLTRCAAGLGTPARSIRADDRQASAGLWTTVARKTPQLAGPNVPRTARSAVAALARATPPTRLCTASPNAAAPSAEQTPSTRHRQRRWIDQTRRGPRPTCSCSWAWGGQGSDGSSGLVCGMRRIARERRGRGARRSQP